VDAADFKAYIFPMFFFKRIWQMKTCLKRHIAISSNTIKRQHESTSNDSRNS
jgi:hypothetical protein